MSGVRFASVVLAAALLCEAFALLACADDGPGSEPCNTNVVGKLEIDVVDAMAAGSPSIDGGCKDLNCSMPVDGGCTRWTAVVTPDGNSCTIRFTSPSGYTTSTTIVTTQGCDGLPAAEFVGVGEQGIDKEI